MWKPVSVGAVLLLFMWPPQVEAQNIDPQFRADTESLLQLTGSGDIEALAKLVAAQVIETLKRSQPDVPERTSGIVTEVVRSEFLKAFEAPDGLRDKWVAIYAMHFTHDEIRVLLDFYRTPLGRKSVSLMPT